MSADLVLCINILNSPASYTDRSADITRLLEVMRSFSLTFLHKQIMIG